MFGIMGSAPLSIKIWVIFLSTSCREMLSHGLNFKYNNEGNFPNCGVTVVSSFENVINQSLCYGWLGGFILTFPLTSLRGWREI